MCGCVDKTFKDNSDEAEDDAGHDAGDGKDAPIMLLSPDESRSERLPHNIQENRRDPRCSRGRIPPASIVFLWVRYIVYISK